MNIKEMNLDQLVKRVSEIKELINDSDSDLNALSDELDQIDARKEELKADAEKRAALAGRISGGEGKVIETVRAHETPDEIRAKEFAKTGVTKRTLLATGKLAKPTAVGGINGLAESGTGIVDDVNAIALTGNGAWTRPYKKTGATAADVTDGEKIGGTGATFDTVTISPNEWGIVDEISNQVKKMTPVNYEATVINSALIALREKAASVILDAVQKSALAEKVVNAALDADYLRNRVLEFKAISGMGASVLYLNREDLVTLGKVRGTQDKKPLYTIEFNDDERTTGYISEGGASVKFRVDDRLEKGIQLFGQPMTIDMPMWDDFAIETNDAEKFSENKIVIRGIQTANADLCAYHGMQVIKQAGE